MDSCQVPSYEDGYLQALRDLTAYHQQMIDDGAGVEYARGHQEAIRFLDRLIATKAQRQQSEGSRVAPPAR